MPRGDHANHDRWRELTRVDPRSFTFGNAMRRLARKRDRWAGTWDDARPPREASRRLEKLRAGTA